MELTPELVIAMWGGGIAAGGALVGTWDIAKPGFLRLVGVVVALVGVFAVIAGGPLMLLPIALAIVPIVVPRQRLVAVASLAVAAAIFLVAALGDSPWLPAATGLVLLGGITSEMVLGHWYLVDPRLPRFALQRLATIGGVGLAGDFAYAATHDGFSWDSDEVIFGWAFVALVVMTALLIVGVTQALRERAYSGVMAATGLSYLAVLTSFGVVVLGRTLTVG